jgi:hypothetical protein
MKSLFEPETHQQILNRIEGLTENTQPQWGKMEVGQMLKHCQIPFEVALNRLEMKGKPGFFKKLIFKSFKSAMYNDRLWKHNLQTPKQFLVTDVMVFALEKDNLIALIDEFAPLKDNTNWPIHPFFGHFTTEQRGQMQYKHLDHHLRQFGV